MSSSVSEVENDYRKDNMIQLGVGIIEQSIAKYEEDSVSSPLTNEKLQFLYGEKESQRQILVEVIGNDFSGFSYAHLVIATSFFIQEEVVFFNNLSVVELQIRKMLEEVIRKLKNYQINNKQVTFSPSDNVVSL